MPRIWIAAVCLAGCTGPEVVDYTAGDWKRHDDQGRVIGRLELDGAGNFTSSYQYYWPTGPRAWGDFTTATGVYELDGEHLTMRGTTRDGYAFDARFTYYADESSFVLAAYVPDPDGADYYALYECSVDAFPQLAWQIRPRLWMTEWSTASSYLLGYIDPIWGTDEAGSGTYSVEPDGTMVFDETITFRVFGEGAALGRVDDRDRGLDYNPRPWHAGMIYERAR